MILDKYVSFWTKYVSPCHSIGYFLTTYVHFFQPTSVRGPGPAVRRRVMAAGAKHFGSRQTGAPRLKRSTMQGCQINIFYFEKKNKHLRNRIFLVWRFNNFGILDYERTGDESFQLSSLFISNS